MMHIAQHTFLQQFFPNLRLFYALKSRPKLAIGQGGTETSIPAPRSRSVTGLSYGNYILDTQSGPINNIYLHT